jgi:hypothetical protein
LRQDHTAIRLKSSTNDLDSDSLPDTWEWVHLGNLNQAVAWPSLNGQTALQNYVAGTTPNDPNSAFKLSASSAGSNRVVSFDAIQSGGIGYEGKERYYALESSSFPVGPGRP